VRSRKNCEALYYGVTLRREIRETRETKRINKATKRRKKGIKTKKYTKDIQR
jgi:hypothetical protein